MEARRRALGVAVEKEPGAVSQRERIALLGAVPAFSRLSPEALASLAGELHEERFELGDVVVREGEPGDRVYLIGEGKAEATTQGPAGTVLLEAYQIGEVFGELALLTPDHIRHASVTAVTPLLALSLEAGAFHELLHQHPEAEDAFHHADDHMLVVKFLKAATPFTKLDLNQIQELAARLERRSVETAVDIVCQGERGDACYLLETGRVSVTATLENGTTRTLATLVPGMLIGEAALITEAPRNATVTALEPSGVLVLRRTDFLDVAGTDARIGRQMRELTQLRDRPRQASGVLVHQRSTHDGTIITTLKDTERAIYYRLSPEGYFLWQRFDGNHTLRDLTLEYMRAFKSFSPEAINEDIQRLAAAGFVETRAVRPELEGRGTASNALERITSSARHAIDWHVSLPNPDRTLTQIFRGGLWILYTPPAQVAIALIAVTGFVVFATHIGEAARASAQGGWLLFGLILSYFVMVVLHELGHAFTVKAFGREVPRAGVGWYWFGPIAFVDTSDMWLAGRWPRIAVTLGGLYASTVVVSVSAGLAALLGPSVAAALLWQLAFLSFYAVLINLNPLMELDGYFILMDWLDHPNLREHCLGWLGTELPSALRHRVELWRHRLELIYGLGAVLYVLLAGFLLLVVYRLVIQGWLERAMPAPDAAALAWIVTGTLVTLALIAVAGDVRDARRRTRGTRPR